MPIKQLTKEVAILCGIAVVCSFVVNFLSPNGIALFGQWDISQGPITARPKNDFVQGKLEIKDPASAKQIYDAGDTIFVDARTQETYQEGHIKGAVSLPAYEFDDLIEGFTTKFPVSSKIVTYCSGRECEDSHELAQLLIDEGYTDVRVFIDGYPAWEKNGYPVEE
jgi:rhodanese-related sulfurtransferase